MSLNERPHCPSVLTKLIILSFSFEHVLIDAAVRRPAFARFRNCEVCKSFDSDLESKHTAEKLSGKNLKISVPEKTFEPALPLFSLSIPRETPRLSRL